MNKKVFKKSLKKLLASVVIALIILPLISINVSALNSIQSIKVKGSIEISHDGRRSKDAKAINFKDYVKTETKNTRALLGSAMESVYDNKTHINSGFQNGVDICWTFGNKNLLESYLSKQEDVDMELSARHMDYVLSNLLPDSINRDPGSGAAPLETFPYFSTNLGPVKEVNFPFNTSISGLDLDDLNKNIENVYLEGYKVFPSIYKEINGDNITYTVEADGLSIEEVPESYIFQLRSNMKQHIKTFGALTAVGLAQNAKVRYPAEEYVYSSSDSVDFDHNLSIIGWDDDFCENNPEGSVLGEQPINSGAWLVSDSNQPYGNQFYYIAYDDTFIEKLLIGIDDVSVGTKYDVYRHDLIGFNDLVYFDPINENGDAEMIYMNAYEKLDTEPEYLNKIGIIAFGNVTIDAYYLAGGLKGNTDIEAEGIYLGSTSLENPEISYFTMDVNNPILINKGTFVIGYKITTHYDTPVGRVSIIPVEREDAEERFDNITLKLNSYIQEDTVKRVPNCNFVIRAYTSSEELSNDTFLVTYDLQGGEGEFPGVNVSAGSYVENSQVPTREGYNFTGWTPDPETTPITKNTVFVANWEKVEAPNEDDDTPVSNEPDVPDNKPDNTATFVFGDGIIRYVEIGEDGYVVSIPTPEKKEGYRFIGWNPDPKRVKATVDTVFYGLWERLGDSSSGETTTEYTKGETNDGTQAPITIPNAGKSIISILVIISISVTGIVFFVKYKRLDI